MSIHELQAALRALDVVEQKLLVTVSVDVRASVRDARMAVIEAARRVAEGAGEPVAWLDDFGNAFPVGANKGAGSWRDEHKRNWRPLFTTPPSADALVEALERLMHAKGFAEIDMAKQAAEQALAKHKENTSGR